MAIKINSRKQALGLTGRIVYMERSDCSYWYLENYRDGSYLAYKYDIDNDVITGDSRLLEPSDLIGNYDSDINFIKVLFIGVDTVPYIMRIRDDLRSYQKLVGGYIEVHRPSSHNDDVVIVCNEDGKLLRLPENRAVRNHLGKIYDVIYGDFLLVNSDVETGEFCDMTQEQIEYYAHLYM